MASTTTEATVPQHHPEAISEASTSNAVQVPAVHHQPPQQYAMSTGFAYRPPPSAVPSASLYVGDLAPEITETVLFETFNQAGPVASIRVCRDAMTKKSLGYAYVNFHNPADAERALDTLNYEVVKDRPMRIMWSQRDPALRKSGVGNIYIKNLDPTIDHKALHDTFSAFGNILSCKVVSDENGQSRGYGYVHFDTLEAAETAIKMVNGKLLNDRKVFVSLHQPRRQRVNKVEEAKAKFTNVFVKDVEPVVQTDEEFREIFAPFGEVANAALARDEQGHSKGFGFVNYVSHEAAANAVETLHGKEYKGKPLYVARAQKKTERQDVLRRQFEDMRLEKRKKTEGSNIYVKNLTDDVDDQKLEEMFSPFGAITSAKIMRDDQGNSKGFGFVCFSSPEEADKAVLDLNGKLVNSKPLYVAPAQKKAERKAMLEQQYHRQGHVKAGIHGGMVPVPNMYPPMYYANVPNSQAYYHVNPRNVRWTQQPGHPPRAAQNGFGQAGAFGPDGGRQQRPRRPQGPPGSVRHMYPSTMPHPHPSEGFVAQPPGNRRFKYGARNSQQYQLAPNAVIPGMVQPVMQVPPAVAIDRGHHRGDGGYGGMVTEDRDAFDTAALVSATPEEVRQTLGEKLYPLVVERLESQQYEAETFAPKITGMLLEMDNGEILNLLENPGDLDAHVNEAVKVLQEHMQNPHGVDEEALATHSAVVA